MRASAMLMLLIRPESGKPIDSATGEPVAHVQERIAHFVEQHDKLKTRIGLPTPALSEVLVRSGASAVQIVEKIKEFQKLAIMTKNALDSGDKKSGSLEVWNKVKYDRQIVAIARVRQATAIYTDDAVLRNIAALLDLNVVGIADLRLPPEKAQGVLPLELPAESSEEPSLEEIEQARDAEIGQPGTV